MLQILYRLKDIDEFTHQISQFGAQFVSKGPVQETYFQLEPQQLRLDQGMRAELLLITIYDHYQEFIDVDIPQHEQLRDLLGKALGEKKHLTKQTIRYHFKQILLEIHRYGKSGDFLALVGDDLGKIKQLARQLSLEDQDRVEQTSLDFA